MKTSEVYEKLYHYTTWDGLIGILKSHTLWATHYKFLNDYSEIILFRSKLISLLLPYVGESYEKLIKERPHIKNIINKNGGLAKVVQHDTEVLVDAQYKATGDEIYIISFCGEHKNPYVNSNGLLSQWRGYGVGGGFSIVFNTKKLEEILEIESQRFAYNMIHISDIVYSEDDNKLKDELSDNLLILGEDAKNIFNAMLNDEDKIDNIKGYYDFVQCISRYKHHSFIEENEVRVVALPTILDNKFLELVNDDDGAINPDKHRNFRNKNSQHVPYIELFDSVEINLPIEKIIVGPHKDKELRAAALRVMLRNTEIEIVCSDIPFVGHL